MERSSHLGICSTGTEHWMCPNIKGKRRRRRRSIRWVQRGKRRKWIRDKSLVHGGSTRRYREYWDKVHIKVWLYGRKIWKCVWWTSISETRAMILILGLHADLPTASMAFFTSVALMMMHPTWSTSLHWDMASIAFCIKGGYFIPGFWQSWVLLSAFHSNAGAISVHTLPLRSFEGQTLAF